MFYRRTVHVRKHEIWITKNNNNVRNSNTKQKHGLQIPLNE